MSGNFEKLEKIVYHWADLRDKTLQNGTRLICYMPHIGSEAWLHCLFAPLSKVEIDDLEGQANVLFPQEFRDFLLNANGAFLFSGKVSVWERDLTISVREIMLGSHTI